MQFAKIIVVLHLAIGSIMAAPVEKDKSGPNINQLKVHILFGNVTVDSSRNDQIKTDRTESQTLNNLTFPIQGKTHSIKDLHEISMMPDSSEMNDSTEELKARVVSRTPIHTVPNSDVFGGVERRHVGTFVKEATDFFGDNIKKFWEATDNNYAHTQEMHRDGIYEVLNTYLTGLIKEEVVAQTNIIRNMEHDLQKATQLEANKYDVLQELVEVEKEEITERRNEISVLSQISKDQQSEIVVEQQQQDALKNIIELNLQENLELNALRSDFSSFQNEKLEEVKMQTFYLARIELLQRQQAVNSEASKTYQLIFMISMIIVGVSILFTYVASICSSNFKVGLQNDEA